MKNIKREVLFGDLEFVELTKGEDRYPAVIVHQVIERKQLTEEQADSYMVKHDYDAYLIPAIFGGEILNNTGGAI